MLKSLLTPNIVAVIGASRTPGKVGHEILSNLIESGFKGTIIPVNPKTDEILGVRCYPDLKSTGKTIDLSIIATPIKFVREATHLSVNAGAKAVVIITAGFREVGEEGARLENDIVGYCRSRHVRVLGPNCLGVINTHHKMNASFAKQTPRQGGITVISQSGALCAAMLDWAAIK